MATNSNIEWTEATWNPVAGCSLVSPGCTRCYAMRMAARLEAMGRAKYVGLTKKVNGLSVWTGKIALDDDALVIPLKRKKPTTWFVNSMSDLFHEGVPFEFVDRVFAVMALCPQHVFQILTKRPERMSEYIATRTPMDDSHQVHTLPQWYQVYTRWFDEGYGGGRFFDTERDWDRAHDSAEKVDPTQALRNVWLGASVEDVKRKTRINDLRSIPAAIRFLSLEPLIEDLGALDLTNINWVIVGGESGPGSRPCNIEWIRSIVSQCRAAGVACFVKQLGAKPVCQSDLDTALFRKTMRDSKGGDIDEFPSDIRVREMPQTWTVRG